MLRQFDIVICDTGKGKGLLETLQSLEEQTLD
jgi:hypothetical protein